MIDPVRELRTRAEILHRRIRKGQMPALVRLRKLPEFKSFSDAQLQSARTAIVRRQCLALLAIELGFSGWPHAKQVLSGTAPVSDFGTLLYPKRCGGLLNLWYRQYDDAVVGRRESGGYLLAFRRDFMVVRSSFIEALGLDPEASEWRALGFDWVRPLDMRARTRLYGELIARETAAATPKRD
jgi:hypothetical protein